MRGRGGLGQQLSVAIYPVGCEVRFGIGVPRQRQPPALRLGAHREPQDLGGSEVHRDLDHGQAGLHIALAVGGPRAQGVGAAVGQPPELELEGGRAGGEQPLLRAGRELGDADLHLGQARDPQIGRGAGDRDGERGEHRSVLGRGDAGDRLEGVLGSARDGVRERPLLPGLVHGAHAIGVGGAVGEARVAVGAGRDLEEELPVPVDPVGGEVRLGIGRPGQDEPRALGRRGHGQAAYLGRRGLGDAEDDRRRTDQEGPGRLVPAAGGERMRPGGDLRRVPNERVRRVHEAGVEVALAVQGVGDAADVPRDRRGDGDRPRDGGAVGGREDLDRGRARLEDGGGHRYRRRRDGVGDGHADDGRIDEPLAGRLVPASGLQDVLAVVMLGGVPIQGVGRGDDDGAEVADAVHGVRDAADVAGDGGGDGGEAGDRRAVDGLEDLHRGGSQRDT